MLVPVILIFPVNTMEIFVAAIMLVGIGVMFRVLNLRAAFMTIGLVCLGGAMLPNAGRFTDYVPSWVFWGVVIILGINVLRRVLSVLFGRSAADNFTGNLLSAILQPVTRLIEGLIRAVFRIR